MSYINEKEKEELIRLAGSESFKKDMRKLHEFKISDNPDYINEYIQFLTVTNAFANHAMKDFKKITGNNFKI